jgi:plasmid stabilization system protein ParE
MREISFLPEVDEDFSRTYSYYEVLSPGRGGPRFEAAFRSAVEEVRRGTLTHLRCFEHYHRVLLARHPYTLYYRFADQRTIIVAVLYSRFAPQTIRRLLGNRKSS